MIFKGLSTLFYIAGIISLLVGFFTWNIALIFSALGNLLLGYAWDVVGDMWDTLEELRKKHMYE